MRSSLRTCAGQGFLLGGPGAPERIAELLRQEPASETGAAAL